MRSSTSDNPQTVFQFVQSKLRTIGYCGFLLASSLGKMLRGKIDVPETLRHIERSGIGSLPIVGLSASFIGMAISVQFAHEIIAKYGAENMIGGFVAIAMIRELAPVFVAIVMAGNIGASITAEIGAMKVTDQVDALQVFGIDELELLVIPRMTSIAISGPILTILGAALSLISGQLFTEALVHVPFNVFWDSARYNTHLLDIGTMLLKSLVFSLAIVSIASYNGLATEGGSERVGENTTKTVVWCLLSIFILNYLLTAFIFQA